MVISGHQWSSHLVEAQAEQAAAVGTHRGLEDKALVVAQEHLNVRRGHQGHFKVRRGHQGHLKGRRGHLLRSEGRMARRRGERLVTAAAAAAAEHRAAGAHAEGATSRGGYRCDRAGTLLRLIGRR